MGPIQLGFEPSVWFDRIGITTKYTMTSPAHPAAGNPTE